MNGVTKSALHLRYRRKLREIRNNIYKTVAYPTVEISADGAPVCFAERSKLEYKKAEKGTKWGALFGGNWLRITGEIPDGVNKRECKLVLNENLFSEALAYDADGVPQQGLSQVVISYSEMYETLFGKQIADIPENCFDGNRFEIWIETGNNGIYGREVFKNKLKRCEIVITDEAMRKFYYDCLCLFFMYSTAESDKKRIKSALEYAFSHYKRDPVAAEAALEKELYSSDDDKKDMTVHALGHSHLDLVWTWPLAETYRKAARTFSTGLKMVEKYPFYIFGASQAAQFEFVKQKYPALYERIKTAVANGKLEPLGCMWVEPDVNMSCGESLINQIKFGRDFYKAEFGFEPKTCWLPDVFGFSANFPQILKKCGVDNFMTIKLSWNKFDEFPFTSFIWQGIDGSEILTHMPPEGKYDSEQSPIAVMSALRKDKDDRRIVNRFLSPFGLSDGGGGASDVNLEFLKREIKGLKGYPAAESGTCNGFFDVLSRSRQYLPRYSGELYLQAHQGAYTSNPLEKYYNRYVERELHKVDFLLSLVNRETDESLWKEALFEAFHDILPGTGTDEVHEESYHRYKELSAKLEKVKSEAIGALRSDSSEKSAVNYSPFARNEWINTDTGWKKVRILPYSAAVIDEKNCQVGGCFAEFRHLRTEKLDVRLDSKGAIASLLFDGKQFSAKGLNILKMYRDKRLWWHASNMDHNYFKKPSRRLKLTCEKYYTDGPTAVAELSFAAKGVKLTQKVVLCDGVDYVRFDTEFEFDRPYRMLRADFCPAFYGENAICDIQFGTVTRSTDGDADHKFEISAHKFVDVSADYAGGALLSDSRYGFRAKDGVLSLCLCRGTVFPAKHGGRGKYKLGYAYLPHIGKYDEKVYENAYNFNYPIESVDGKIEFSHESPLCGEGLIEETVKQSGEKKLSRIYECLGKKTTAKATAENVWIADALGTPKRRIDDQIIDVEPFELLTVLYDAK